MTVTRRSAEVLGRVTGQLDGSFDMFSFLALPRYDSDPGNVSQCCWHFPEGLSSVTRKLNGSLGIFPLVFGPGEGNRSYCECLSKIKTGGRGFAVGRESDTGFIDHNHHILYDLMVRWLQ